MRARFWGVRGSIATPLTPDKVKARISAVVQRISSNDLVSPDAREKFIATLPPWIYGAVGGNTSCVEVETSSKQTLIFDAGTGLRELGWDLVSRPDYGKNNDYHLFISHFHWDHIQGLPFFEPAYDERSKITVYSTRKDAQQVLEGQMTNPYFPIPMLGERGFAAKFAFRCIDRDEVYINIGKTRIGTHLVRHPGGCTAYSVADEGKKLIYSTDTELRAEDFKKNPENTEFYTKADYIIIDSQYTLSDAIIKEGWGHSTFSVAVDFAANWDIKNMVLFHHEPTYSDQKIFNIRESADWYRGYSNAGDIKIIVAQEGLELLI